MLGGRQQTQIAGDREYGEVTDLFEVPLVKTLDYPPLRVEIGLRQHRRHIRADTQRMFE